MYDASYESYLVQLHYKHKEFLVLIERLGSNSFIFFLCLCDLVVQQLDINLVHN